jgi:hypothetical protein
MALLAFASPILPGKTEEWRGFVRELTGPRAQEFAESRRRAGLHERTFLQPSPMGDLVITTFEGDDPGGALQRLIDQDDEFTRWFLEQVQRVHGVDLSQPLPALPELVADSEASSAS